MALGVGMTHICYSNLEQKRSKTYRKRKVCQTCVVKRYIHVIKFFSINIAGSMTMFPF